MNFEPVFIKSELQDECLGSSDIFQHDIPENVTELFNSPKREAQYEVEEFTKSFDNEETHKNDASVLCKNEPDYSFTSNETDSACSKINIEDVSNEDNKMNILKMEIFYCNENSLDSIKQEEVDLPVDSESSDNETDSGCSKMNADVSNEDNKSKSFTCQFCDKSYVRKQSLDNHLVKKHSKEIKSNFKDLITYKIYSCQLCSFQSTHKSQLNRHNNSLHNEQKSNNVNSICTKEKSKSYSCQFCIKWYVYKQSLDNHLVSEHFKNIKRNIKDFISHKIYTCKVCPYQTTFKNKLDAHVDSNHNEQRSKSIFCQFCNKAFVIKRSRDDHILKYHQNEINADVKYLITSKIHTCQLCSFQSTHKTQLNKHMNSFHNKQQSNDFSCQFCTNRFKAKRSLDDHMLQEHSKKINSNIKNFISHKIYACKVCFYRTIFKNKLETHVNSIHNKQRSKNISCQFCDKTFVFRRSLDDHILKHHQKEINSDVKELIASKIHTCQFCSYQSTLKMQLIKHINSFHSKQI